MRIEYLNDDIIEVYRRDTLVKTWTPEDTEGNSPYNYEAWEVNYTDPPEYHEAELIFTISEEDLQ